MASLEWSLRLVPSRGPDCHLCTSRLPEEQVAPGTLARHTLAPTEGLGSKVWRKRMLGEMAWETAHLCQGLLVSLLGSWTERTVLLSVCQLWGLTQPVS